MAVERPIAVYTPAGALGLYDRDAVVQLRLNETDAAVRPQDAAGALSDLDPSNSGTGALTMPAVVDGVLGRARLFDGVSNGLAAFDIAPGASLLTRDLSLQLVLAWDVAGQLAAGHPGTLVCRGLGGSVAQYVSYGLRLDVVDAPSFTGQARWFWQDTAGVAKLQVGGDFTCQPGTFTLLTATRRWVSSTQVRLRYYLGEALLAEVLSADTSIGGGTTGTFELGTQLIAGVDGNFFVGAIDELLILPREMCAEEIETTWQRLTTYQPRGTQLYLQMHDPGYPLPDQPGSDAALEIRMVGHALGAAASRTEDLRANFLPGRAYGDNLAAWEALCLPHPGTGGSIEERRARVLARMRQRRGSSLGGLQDLLSSLLGGADPSQLQFLAFDNTLRDSFDAVIDPLRWDKTPNPNATAWHAGGTCRFAPVAGTYTMTGSVRTWLTLATSIAQPTVAGQVGLEHVLAKMVVTTPQNGLEVGVWVGDKGVGNYLLLGLRDVAGVFEVVTEGFVANVSQGLAVQATPGANPAAIWLHLNETSSGQWVASWSTTSVSTGYASSAPIAYPTAVYWAGFYLRSTAALGAGPVVDFDDFVLRTPNAARPFNAYALLDRALGFTPDVAAARDVVETIKHAFIHGTFITTPLLLCDDPDNGCDVAPCGGY